MVRDYELRENMGGRPPSMARVASGLVVHRHARGCEAGAARQPPRAPKRQPRLRGPLPRRLQTPPTSSASSRSVVV